jgi:hypothetical protein
MQTIDETTVELTADEVLMVDAFNDELDNGLDIPTAAAKVTAGKDVSAEFVAWLNR